MKIIEKPSGCTVNEFIERYKKEHQINKLCFCGRLDPMARGKLMILIDDECKQINKYLNYDKTYEFQICFGFQTDTDDFLGFIEKTSESLCPLDLNNIIKYIKSLNGYKFEQQFHKYSSKKINGKTLREQELKNLPKHNVKILSTDILGISGYDFDDFINLFIIPNIESIDKTKNFRQSDTINQWKNINRKFLLTLKVRLKVTSGFYVRQFVRDLSNKFNFPMVVFDINRTAYNI